MMIWGIEVPDIDYDGERCFLCQRNGATDKLENHHIFNGPYRKKSEKYGLKVKLCHHDCHIFGPNAVHNNQERDNRLKQLGQIKVMHEQGWDTERFIKEFGKNYL
jgi:hypothetical protein